MNSKPGGMTKDNIMVLHDHWVIGGAEKLTVNLIDHWRTLGYKTIVVSLNADNPVVSELEHKENGFVIIPRMFRYDLRMVRKIRSLIQKGNIRIIVALDPFDFFVIRLASLRTNPHPCLILTIHSTQPENKWSFVKSWLFTRFLSKTDHILAVCDTQKEYWSCVYKIPRNKFSTVHNGVDTQYFSPDHYSRQKIRGQIGITEKNFVIIQVASLNPRKRHEVSFQALKILRELDPSKEYKLLIVGGNFPAREETLKRFAKQLEIQDSIFFLGNQSDVRPFYHAADLFTLSSAFVETFSIAALEAMSMGLPCVLTDIGGAKEMIRPGFNGYLVPIENPHALAEAWRSVSESESNFDHQAIRQYVIQQFNLPDCSLKYLRLFHELCHG